MCVCFIYNRQTEINKESSQEPFVLLLHFAASYQLIQEAVDIYTVFCGIELIVATCELQRVFFLYWNFFVNDI